MEGVLTASNKLAPPVANRWKILLEFSKLCIVGFIKIVSSDKNITISVGYWDSKLPVNIIFSLQSKSTENILMFVLFRKVSILAGVC